MMNNMMIEMNDNELDMVNGGGFFDVVKGLASDLWQAAKDVVTVMEVRDRIMWEHNF